MTRQTKIMLRTFLMISFLGLLVGMLGLTVVVALRDPSLTRDWDDDVRILAGVELGTDDRIEFTGLRDWTYTLDAVVSKSYFDASYDPNDIVEVWMYEQRLDRMGLIAHTFLVFEFDESYDTTRYLGLSVETRRESDEVYSLIGGVMRSFEVTHIWATERDLVRRRVEYLDYPLTRYRLEIPAEYRSRIFVKLAEETKMLGTTPRWYNTVLNNCTSSLIKYVNESEPDAIPTHYSYVFTGRVDEYLEKLGYLDPDYSLAVTRDFLAHNDLR